MSIGSPKRTPFTVALGSSGGFRTALNGLAGETAAPFSSVSVDSAVLKECTQESVTDNGLTTITTTYTYDGRKFCVDVYVDAVQTHSATDAKLSAWGVDK